MLSSTHKKWRLFRAWSGRHPVWCSWQVTYRCNFRCQFCGYWHDPAGRAAEPTLEDYRQGARKLSGMGSLLVSLAGGEPLLRKDIAQIVEAVAGYHLPFVTTNGWLLTPELARDLMRAGVWGVSVSIDYADAARHDRRRGVQGAWEQAWRAVEMLVDARQHDWQRVNVLAVLMDDNIDDMAGIVEMAARRNSYFMVQPYGQLKTGSAAFSHNDGPVAPRLLHLHRRWPNFLSNTHYLRNFDRFLHGGVPGCRAGRAFFNVDSTGEVSICVEHRNSPVGNLYQDPLPWIRRRLREAGTNNPCTDCWYNCRGEVESLYAPGSLIASLPTLLFDRGKAPPAGASRVAGGYLPVQTDANNVSSKRARSI